MTKKRLTLMGTNADELKGIVSEVVNDTFQARDNKKRELEDKKVKQEHIDKTLKKDKVEERLKKSKKHEHSCPTCHSAVKKISEGFEVCEDCGATTATLQKGHKLLICNTCGGIIPESFVMSKEPCPHCGGNGAHWAK